MEDKPKITLIFFCLFPEDVKITCYRLCFGNQIHDIDYNAFPTYEIPDAAFKLGKDKAKINVFLYNSSKELINTIEYDVYYGKNSAHIQTDGDGKGYNFEMIFKNAKDLKISYQTKEFSSLDDNNTKDRKKITILNYNFTTIKVNEKEINIKNLCNKGGPSNFHQISMDLEDDKIIVQPSEKIDLPDFDKIIKKANILNSFNNKICEIFKDQYKYIYKEEFHRIVNYFIKKVDLIEYNLNLSRSYLDEYFAKHSIELDIIYKYQLFCISYKYRKKYAKNKVLFKKTVEELSKFCNEIKEISNLEIYEKIRLITKISYIISKCRNEEELNEININYIIISDCEADSIIKKTEKYFNEFVTELSEDSKIFPYLLNLDSGFGYCDDNLVYTFDMTNLTMIKNHLNEFFPKVLLFYYFPEDSLANVNRSISCIAINTYNLFEDNSSKEIVFDKVMKNNDDVVNDMVINLFIILLHECMGHVKFGYKRNRNPSPKRIISETKQILELKRKCDFNGNLNGKEYILGSNCKTKGDSGTFLEFAYGKYKNDLITNLMLKVNDKGKLLNRINLFMDHSCEILKKYIILKYVAKEKQINIKPKNSIEEEIKEYEKFINYEELLKDQYYPKEKKQQFIGKKVKRNKVSAENDFDLNSNIKEKNKIKKVDYNESEHMNYFLSEEYDKNNEEEESDSEEEENEDEGEIIDKLYHKLLPKYGIKEDDQLLRKISEKANDKTINQKDRHGFFLLRDYMDNLE